MNDQYYVLQIIIFLMFSNVCAHSDRGMSIWLNREYNRFFISVNGGYIYPIFKCPFEESESMIQVVNAPYFHKEIDNNTICSYQYGDCIPEIGTTSVLLETDIDSLKETLDEMTLNLGQCNGVEKDCPRNPILLNC